MVVCGGVFEEKTFLNCNQAPEMEMALQPLLETHERESLRHPPIHTPTLQELSWEDLSAV